METNEFKEQIFQLIGLAIEVSNNTPNKVEVKVSPKSNLVDILLTLEGNKEYLLVLPDGVPIIAPWEIRIDSAILLLKDCLLKGENNHAA